MHTSMPRRMEHCCRHEDPALVGGIGAGAPSRHGDAPSIASETRAAGEATTWRAATCRLASATESTAAWRRLRQRCFSHLDTVLLLALNGEVERGLREDPRPGQLTHVDVRPSAAASFPTTTQS